MLYKCGNKRTRDFWERFYFNFSLVFYILAAIFNKNSYSMPLALVGQEMIVANSYPKRGRGIIVKHCRLRN